MSVLYFNPQSTVDRPVAPTVAPTPPLLFRGDSIDRAAAGAAGAPLTAEQKRNLIMVASKAYKVQTALNIYNDGTFDAWRHEQAREACGVGSFCAMQQRHYLKALAKFRMLAGEDVSRLTRREVGDGTRRAFAKLQAECREQAEAFGGVDAAMEYAGRLSSAMLKCPLPSASERGVWRVVYTLRHRAQQIRRRGTSPVVAQPSP